MNRSEIMQRRQAINNALKSLHIHNAIELIESLQKDTATANFNTELENIKLEHNYLLKYFSAGVNDQQRGKIYQNFANQLQRLTDKIICEDLTKNDFNRYYTYKRIIKKKSQTLNEILLKYEKVLKDIDLLYEAESEISLLTDLRQKKEQYEIDIFNYVWTIFPATKDDLSALSSIYNNDIYPLYFKELLISAILLSLLEYYDDQLFIILLSLYNSNDNKLSIKALIASLLVLFRVKDSVSQNINLALSAISENTEFYSDLKNIILQLVKSKNTERISQKMQDAIMSNIKKASPDFMKKFSSDASLSDINDFESNPEWKKIFENDEFTSKIEEINRLQMEGGDVFASTFCHLKSFPFFEHISNWFLPFHTSHSLVKNSLNDKEIQMIDIMLGSKFLCDSDKYSFVASLNSVPYSQREMMMSQLNEQNIALNELKASELQSESKITKETIANNYIQNLYRFFKFYRNKNEYFDPFTSKFDIIELHKLIHIDNINDLLMLIGEFNLKNELYSDALFYLNSIDNYVLSENPIIHQKIGFCYQNIGEYLLAIEHYKKYELLFNKDLWNLKHLAVCYKATKQIENALKCYLEADEIAPDNINTTLNIGHCYLELGKYNDAIKYYYKANYLDPSSPRSCRPLSWCLFMMKEFSQSENYYSKIISQSPTAVDYLNYGHLKFAKNEIPEAISCYKKAIELYNNSIAKFEESYLADSTSMIQVGISASDIHILLDSLYHTEI